MKKPEPTNCAARQALAQATMLVLAALALTACGRSREAADNGARQLQNELAAILADPSRCPITGTSADLQALVKNRDAGGVVRIPAGCYQVTKTIGIPEDAVVVGAGTDQTLLYRDPAASANRDGAMFMSFGRNGGGPRISGISFLGVRDSNDRGEDTALHLYNSRNFRVDHCYFEGFGFAAVRVEGKSRGVVDHCLFVDNYKEGIGNLGYGLVVYGDKGWADDPRPGSAKAIFVEDSTFLGNRHAIAASGGAHYVFRHNVVLDNVEACAVDAHGAGYGQPHGTRYVEIYGNRLEATAGHWCGIGIRGGAGVIYDNVIDGFENPILLVLEWGLTDQQKAEYPAKDQVQDLWIWDNEIAGGPAKPRIDDEGRGYIREGRDYYLEARPGYAPCDYPHPLTRE